METRLCFTEASGKAEVSPTILHPLCRPPQPPSRGIPPPTIPPQLVCTSSRPDIVIVQDQAVKMIELTICSNSLNAMKEARRRKESKQNYQSLLSYLCKKGLNASYLTLEINALGHHPPDFPKRLVNFLGINDQKNNLRSILDDAGKIAISSSQIIFWAKDCQSWDPKKLLLS